MEKIEKSPVDYMRWYHRWYGDLWARLSARYEIPALSKLEHNERDVYCGLKPGGIGFWKPSEGAAAAMTMVGDVNKWVVWDFCKRVYMMHPALQPALTDSVDEKTSIPGESLRRLPHDEALVWLAQPISTWSEVDRRQETYLGLLFMGAKDWMNPTGESFEYSRQMRHIVAGTTNRDSQWSQLCRLSDPEAKRVSITFVGYADEVTEHGAVRYPTRITLSVNLDETWTLLGAALECAETMTRLDRYEESPENMRRRDAVKSDLFAFAESEIIPLLKTAIGTMAYLSSDEADIVERPASSNKATARREAREGVTKYNLGYRIGPQIDAAIKPRQSSDGEPTGRTIAPHIRRGHFHTVTYGPGRTMRRVRWFAPIAVNKDKTQPADVVTLHGLGS